MRGTVVAFDDHVGLGMVRADDGRDLPFHCTALTDGSRTIDVGTAVTFEIRPALPARWEATKVQPVERREAGEL